MSTLQTHRQRSFASLPVAARPAFRRSSLKAFSERADSITSLVFRIHQHQLETTTLSRDVAMAEIRTKHGVRMSKRSARIVENVARRDTISAIQLRNGYILLKVEYIKCVVLPDRVYLFDVQLPLVHQFAQHMLRSLQGTTDEHLPFPLRCIDIALDTITNDYERRLSVFLPVLNAVLMSSGVGRQTSQPALLRLLPLQNAVMNFVVALNEFLSAVRDFALSDPALWDHLMPGNHPEVRLIAESYIKITEELVNEVTQFQRRIDATRATVEATLDIQRNNILNLNIRVSMAALAIGTGAMVASVFGMNLRNHFEESATAFPIVVGGIIFLCSLTYGALLLGYYSRLRAPRSLHSILASSDFYKRLNDQPFINLLHDTKSKARWCKILQLAVGKRLQSPTAAEVLMTHHQAPTGLPPLGYDHTGLGNDGRMTSVDAMELDGYFGSALSPQEIDHLLEEVMHPSRPP